jgi:multiple sugar transport system permease protein
VQGAPGRLVRVLVYDLFENGFRFFKMGYAASEAMYLFAIILVLTIIQFRFLRGSNQ